MATGSLFERNGTYHAIISYYNEYGERRQKWYNTKLAVRGNKKKAEKILNDLLLEWDKKNVKYCDLTVAEYFKNWIKEIELEVKPNTYRSYKGNMENHIIPYFESKDILIQELKPYHLEDYYKFKLKPHSKLRSDEALSHTTIKHHHQNISKALSDAVRKDIIHYNPASYAKTPKTETYKSEFLNPKQLQDLLLLFKGSSVEIPVTLCAIYGFRRSEVLGLSWNSIDFVNRTITISQTLQQHKGENTNYIDTPKTESSYRTLPLTEDVYQMLKKHKELQRKRKELIGNNYVDNNFVCTWEDGNVIAPNYLSRTFHKIIIKSTLPHIRLHDLRHSVASNLLNNGFSVVQVAEWLGHSSSSTTLKFYAHSDKTSKIQIAVSLNKMIVI